MRYQNRPAFTLIELTVVAAVIAIFAAIALPRLGAGMRNQRLNAAARRVAADLALAQSRAKASGATRTVVFDTASSSYRIPQETPLDRSTGTYSVSLAADPYGVAVTEANFNSTATATFDGYGRPASGGRLKVRLDGVSRTITLDADSGKAVIQ